MLELMLLIIMLNLMRRLGGFTANVTDVDSIAKIADGVDLVVNATLLEFNVYVMRAVLKAETNYGRSSISHTTL